MEPIKSITVERKVTRTETQEIEAAMDGLRYAALSRHTNKISALFFSSNRAQQYVAGNIVSGCVIDITTGEEV